MVTLVVSSLLTSTLSFNFSSGPVVVHCFPHIDGYVARVRTHLFRLLGGLILASSCWVAAENTAIVPVTKLENDSYDWNKRHQEVLEIKTRIQPEVVLIGDSITHFWAGEPASSIVRGPKAWQSLFGSMPTLNLGFGWDRTQNVLWRIDHGELDGITPRIVVIHIGTNNTSTTGHAKANTAEEITDGVATICDRVRAKLPAARIILMAIFPREEKPDHPRRQLIDASNHLLERMAASRHLDFINLAGSMLKPDGTLTREMMPDLCHPSEKAYQIWADALRPYVRPLAFPDPATAGGKGGFNTTWLGFKNCWINRHQTFMKTRESDRNAVVFLGDSITEQAPLATLYPSIRSANRGISGDTSRGMLARLDDHVLSLDPRAVVILAGTNDLFQPGNSPQNTASNIAEICQKIRDHQPSAQVIICKIPPNNKPDAADAALFNAAIDQRCSAIAGVTIVDTYTPFFKHGKMDASLFKDGVHPNQNGYEVFRKTLEPQLTKLKILE